MAQLERCFRDGMLYKNPTEIVHMEPTAELALRHCEAEVARLKAAHATRTLDDAAVTDESRSKKRKAETEAR